MTRVFSGIQPSGDLHLGNYLGALKQWVEIQERADTVYCIVDLHAITVSHDPKLLAQRTLEVATGLLACGVDPERSILFVQSHVHEHAECTWLFNCVAGMGELGRQPQFKEKSGGQDDSVTVGLFDYPVLQTADILLYHADEVPVGEDQRHHIELARDLGQRFNHRFGEVFTLPQAIHPAAAARVMDLQNPSNKMSKSADSPKGTVLLLDEPNRVAKKIKSAVTDSGSEVHYDRDGKPGISNLMELFSAVTGRDFDDIQAEFDGNGYGGFKTAVADAVVELLRPIQERHAELVDDPGAIRDVLAAGADKARAIAAPTLAAAKQAVGFLPAR